MELQAPSAHLHRAQGPTTPCRPHVRPVRVRVHDGLQPEPPPRGLRRGVHVRQRVRRDLYRQTCLLQARACVHVAPAGAVLPRVRRSARLLRRGALCRARGKAPRRRSRAAAVRGQAAALHGECRPLHVHIVRLCGHYHGPVPPALPGGPRRHCHGTKVERCAGARRWPSGHGVGFRCGYLCRCASR